MAVSVIGRDRPGIVASIAKVLFQNRCNIEDLSQTAIRGQFAKILITSTASEESFLSLKQDFDHLAGDLDLEIHLKLIKREQMQVFDTSETEPFVITVRGKDRPGLVYGIAEILAERSINITKLDARVALIGGKQEYIQLFEVDIPKRLDYGLIQEKLRQRGQEMGILVDLQHKEIFRAINQI
jgi:glycine cleavage system transcriptional repressor